MAFSLKRIFRSFRLNSFFHLVDVKRRMCSVCKETHTNNGPHKLRHIEVIKQITEASDEEIIMKLIKNIELQMLSEEQVRNGLLKFKKLGITGSTKVDVLTLLKLHTTTVQNRTMILQEAGFVSSAITVGAIMKYLSLSKLKVEELKKKHFIKPDTNVWQHMASFLEHPLANLNDKGKSDDVSITSIKLNVLKQYLQNKLDLSIEQFEANTFLSRMNHKSLRVIRENINLAQRVLGISDTRLRNNLFLLVLNPENTLDILDRVQEIGGIDVRHAINTHPKILVSPCDTLLQIKQHLKNYGIPNESVLKCVEVYTLNSDTVLNRLRELERNEFFMTCRQHPRVLELIMYQKKAIKRLELLKDNKMHNTTLNLIASPEKAFEKFYEIGGCDKPKGTDILHFLCSELNTDKKSLRAVLKRHPYWAYVPLVQFGKNITTLRKMGFTDDLILKDVYILLYPTERIISELQILLGGLRSGLDSCKKSDGSIRRELLLQLVIYGIEKTCNFTGEAVWSGSLNTDTTVHQEYFSDEMS